jgi:hypothetical protein
VIGELWDPLSSPGVPLLYLRQPVHRSRSGDAAASGSILKSKRDLVFLQCKVGPGLRPLSSKKKQGRWIGIRGKRSFYIHVFSGFTTGNTFYAPIKWLSPKAWKKHPEIWSVVRRPCLLIHSKLHSPKGPHWVCS